MLMVSGVVIVIVVVVDMYVVVAVVVYVVDVSVVAGYVVLRWVVVVRGNGVGGVTVIFVARVVVSSAVVSIAAGDATCIFGVVM